MSNPAPIAPFVVLLIIAAVAAQRRKVLRAFEAAGATSPDAARTADDLKIRYRRRLRELVQAGVLRPVGEDRYYLDTAAREDWDRRRQRTAVIALAAVVALSLVILAVTLLLGPAAR